MLIDGSLCGSFWWLDLLPRTWSTAKRNCFNFLFDTIGSDLETYTDRRVRECVALWKTEVLCHSTHAAWWRFGTRIRNYKFLADVCARQSTINAIKEICIERQSWRHNHCQIQCSLKIKNNIHFLAKQFGACGLHSFFVSVQPSLS